MSRIIWLKFCCLTTMLLKTGIFLLFVHCGIQTRAQSVLPPPEVETPVTDSTHQKTELPELFNPYTEANFPGGALALQQYIIHHFNYDSIAVDSDYLASRSAVYLKFVVCSDGSIEQVSVVKGISSTIDRYCKRFIMEMPHWNPALDENNLPVDTQVVFPIRICLH